MLIAEPLGVVGAPLETLRALQAHLANADLAQATLTLVTDTQGQRAVARYAALVIMDGQAVVTVDAFGGQYGPEGARALRELAAWAAQRGMTRVRETVVNTYDFNRVMREPSEAEILQLMAAANPSALDIYLG